MNVADIRTDYKRARLRREDLRANPIVQFKLWLEQACSFGITEPTAMTLATVGRNHRPLTRTVLLKGIEENGFIFYTNLGSRKAQHIEGNPNVSLLFPWLTMERQVVITGVAEKLPTSKALLYFLRRPRESQLSAWASRQSCEIPSRKLLEETWERMKIKFESGQVPLPTFWGGYLVVPETIEFWQGGPNRLHDRFEYVRQDEGWKMQRLAP